MSVTSTFWRFQRTFGFLGAPPPPADISRKRGPEASKPLDRYQPVESLQLSSHGVNSCETLTAPRLFVHFLAFRQQQQPSYFTLLPSSSKLVHGIVNLLFIRCTDSVNTKYALKVEQKKQKKNKKKRKTPQPRPIRQCAAGALRPVSTTAALRCASLRFAAIVRDS